MANKKKTSGKKKRQKKQSIRKNSALFILSLCFLIAASMLTYSISKHPELPLNPANYKINRSREVSTIDKPAPEKKNFSTLSSVEYSFYDILYHQDHSATTDDHHYTIQIAAFKSDAKAETFVKKIKADKKIRCRVVRAGNWYHIRWGTFPTRSAADRYQKKLSKVLERECMIVKM